MKIAFATLGCKVNQYDTGAIETALLGPDDRVVPFAEGADVYIVNSCTVTDRADAESRQLARRARRLNPQARVILTGCFAQASPDRAAAVAEADYVVGIGRLPDLLRAVRGEVPPGAGRVLVADARSAERVGTFGARTFNGQTRAFLKVQEGCDLFCSFCIVPMARGRSRSVEPACVMEELERLAERGFREVVLTGVHLGAYGQDLDRRVALADLLEMIAAKPPGMRIRLSSIDPPEVTSRVLELIAASDAFCRHLHVPIQAGADSVLGRMRRTYDVARVRDVVAEIGRVLPGAAVGTDVIAGFPGETAEDFADGAALIAALPFSYLHVFPYSRRRGTTAAKLGGHHAPNEVRARARHLRQIGAAKRRDFGAGWVGREVEVLAEHSRERVSALLIGYSREYLRVLFEGPDRWMNRCVRVRVLEARCEGVFGCCVEGGALG